MRLWHEDLITKLPRAQLLGQHRECCALRGAGWGRKHSTVDYVFRYSPYKLFQYHQKVLSEMRKRGYQPDILWDDPLFRGKIEPAYQVLPTVALTSPIYHEHDNKYLQECLLNLASKGIDLT